ncbi:MAG: Smr/MutS family protein [Clostridia bacterium]|nr:Smr/MutS family protein [Clostridia bacterium]
MHNIGEKVNIIGSSLNGIIVRKKTSTDCVQYVVKIDNKYILVDEEKIQKYIENSNINKRKKYRENVSITLQNNKDFQSEIMLRHQTVEEALVNLDKFIDTAICNKINRIKIIHGKSGGVLRKAVHEYLKNDSRISEFYLGSYFEGQFGVTIAIIK